MLLFCRGVTFAPAVRIALVLGTLYSLVNQGGVLAGGNATAVTWLRVAFNYLAPFGVASIGFLAARRRPGPPCTGGTRPHQVRHAHGSAVGGVTGSMNPSRDQPLGRFLDLVAAATPAPAGGSAAAVAAALGASLVAMAARLSTRHLADASTIAAEADRLREAALVLADDDARAYREVRAAYALPKGASGRDGRIRVALERATDVPLEVVRVAAGAAALGSRLVEAGNPNLKGDAVTAVLLAEAAARGAATLVELNVTLGGLQGDWLRRAGGYLATAAGAARRAGRP